MFGQGIIFVEEGFVVQVIEGYGLVSGAWRCVLRGVVVVKDFIVGGGREGIVGWGDFTHAALSFFLDRQRKNEWICR